MSTQLTSDPDDEDEPVIVNTISFSAVSNSQDSSVDLFPPNSNSKSNEKPGDHQLLCLSPLIYLLKVPSRKQHNQQISIMIAHIASTSSSQSTMPFSPQRYLKSLKLNESFEDNNSTYHKNSSSSNSDNGGSSFFITHSGIGRMFSEKDLSPLCTANLKQLSDLSTGGNIGACSSFNAFKHNTSMMSQSSQSSANSQMEVKTTLGLVRDYLEKDVELYDEEMFDYLVESLNETTSENAKEYYIRIITHFQEDNSEFAGFFHQRIFDDVQASLNNIPFPLSISMVNSLKFYRQHSNQEQTTTAIIDRNSNTSNNSRFTGKNSELAGFSSQQNMKIGQAMSGLIFQMTIEILKELLAANFRLLYDTIHVPIYYLPTPVGMSSKEAESFEKRLEQIRINIGQVIRDYADIRSVEFLQSNLTSTLLIVFLQTISVDSKEKNLFEQLQEKIKAKKNQYELETVQKRNKIQNLMMIPHNLLGNNSYPRPISASIYQSNTISTFPEKTSSSRPSSGSSNGNNSSVLFNSANISNIFTSNNSSNLHNSLNLQSSQSLVISNTQSQQQPSSLQTSLPQPLQSSSSSNQFSSYCLSESDLRARKKNEQIYRQLALYEPSALILYPVELIAKVMSSIDAKWFLRLNLQSLLNSKINDRQKCSQIQKYSQRFNNLVYWFMHLIVSHRTIDMRVNQLAQLIEIIQLIDQDYHSYPSMHAIYTVLSYMKLQLPITWQKLEDKLRIQKKWVAATLEIQRYSHTFNDKYYGYKQETQKLTQSRTHYIPCMNPYFQDIYSDEAKLSASKKNSQFVIPRLLHERISDRLLTLLALQKTCEKHYPMLEAEAYKDFRNYKLDESQLFALFKKKSIKDIDDILTTKNLRFKDLEVYFIEKCKALEPTQ